MAHKGSVSSVFAHVTEKESICVCPVKGGGWRPGCVPSLAEQCLSAPSYILCVCDEEGGRERSALPSADLAVRLWPEDLVTGPKVSQASISFFLSLSPARVLAHICLFVLPSLWGPKNVFLFKIGFFP